MLQHDVSARHIGLAGAAIGGTVALVIAVVLGVLHAIGLPGGGERLQSLPGMEVSGPALQSAPQLDLQRYRDEKQRQLERRGWVDARHGVARIPIERAIALLAQGAASAPGGDR